MVGIDFGHPFPSIDHLILQDYQNEKYAPAYKYGILASADVPKGKVLVAFLKSIGWRPSKIIFVDDKMSSITSVENELEKENIPHTSFHYTAAKDQNCIFDADLADFQIQHLIETFEWLSDQEVMSLLNLTNG